MVEGREEERNDESRKYSRMREEGKGGRNGLVIIK
jgi:hypothetical protein